MIYLSGGLSPSYLERFPNPRVGYMLTFPKASRGDRTARPFAFDNGCYARPDAYDDDRYLRWLDTRERAGCMFATAPDVVGDWRATIVRSTPMLARIRALGFPVALVAQDGLDPLALDWDAFDTLFVGGSTAYKLSEPAYALPALARSRGKPCHMGRCNSRIRLRAAVAAGYTSADGRMLAFGRRVNWIRVTRWIDEALRQPSLLVADADARSDDAA